MVALCAGVIALIGNGPSLPIDSHEAFVARTSEEMIARQSWIVPYFNDEPRINKPPLCYWLVIATDWLNGGDGAISEWEARVPSIIASIVLACGTATLGMLFFGRWIGLIAGLIICSSGGFSAYSHSARPEMVYAAWCTLGLVAFALAQISFEKDKRQHNMLYAWAGWLMFGLATMTKGPWLPSMLIVGWVAGMIASGRRNQIRAVLRPAVGLLIVLGASLWWYALIAKYVPNWRELLAAETTTGRIFNYDEFSAWNYLDPYYIYRTFGLIMPWAVLYPLAIAAPWIFKSRFDDRSRQLWWVLLIPLITLHISIGRRWYYLLPALAPLAILMAKFGLDAGRILLRDGNGALWKALAILHVIGFALAIILFRVFELPSTEPPLGAIGVVLTFAAAVVLLMLHAGEANVAVHVPRTVICVLMVAIVFLAAAQIQASVWDSKRMRQRQFARAVDRAVPNDAQLAAWSGDWAREVYYGRRHIKTIVERAALEAMLPQPGDTYLLVEEPPDDLLLHVDEVVVTEMEIDGKRRQLVRIADGS